MDEKKPGRPAAELDQAHRARQAGKEGRARVCARRAAGWALADYYTSASNQPPGENAYHVLVRAGSDDQLPGDVRQAAARLTTPVEPDFQLPHEEDPLADAALIISAMMQRRPS